MKCINMKILYLIVVSKIYIKTVLTLEENTAGLELNPSESVENALVDLLEADDEVVLKILSESAKSAQKNATVPNSIFNTTLTDILCDKNNSINHFTHENNEKCGKLNDFVSEKRNISELFFSADVGQTSVSNETDNRNEEPPLSKQNKDFPPEVISIPKLIEIIPPFSLSTAKGVSDECRLQNDIFLKSLHRLELWAVKMYDASAKIPSGFLNGNINQYGDMDQCLDVRHVGESRTSKRIIEGKYCLASLQLSLSSNASGPVKQVFNLVHSHHAFRSNLRDPGHRVPRFSSINWALCVPAGCSPSDVQLTLEHLLAAHSKGAQIAAEVLVEPQMCQIASDANISSGTILVGCLFLAFILLVLVATALEIFNKEQTPKLILSFSLHKNIMSLFSLRRAEGDVEAVHGIRCLNAIMLLIAHKSMAIFFVPFMNRTSMTESLGQPWSVIGRAASLYTDPFIMFSGLLTCYSFLNKAKKGQAINIKQEYLGRLFRLVPTLGALILFCTWLLPWLGSGPQWPLVISHHAYICRTNWWKNLLFVHNYFGFHNMCLTHTHHIGIDTQLFGVGVPLALWLATRPAQRRNAVALLVLLALISTAGRFLISYFMELANYVFFGTSVEQLFRTADHMYILPAYRFTVYTMGLLMGLLLHCAPATPFTKTQLQIGWVTSIGMLFLSFLSPAGMGRVGYQYNPVSQASYAAFAPIGWCAGFAWIIYTQHHGYNNWITRFFSLRVFLIWTRLSYAVYLTQFPVYFYYVGSMRTSQYYSFPADFLDLKEILVIIFYSVVLTLLFDLPFQNIKKIVCRRKQNATRISDSEKNTEINKSEIKLKDTGHSVSIIERNCDKKLWKAD